MKNLVLTINGVRLDKLRVMMKTKPSFCSFAEQKKKRRINPPPLDRLRFNESTEAFFLLGKDKKKKIDEINVEKIWK